MKDAVIGYLIFYVVLGLMLYFLPIKLVGIIILIFCIWFLWGSSGGGDRDYRGEDKY